jgi:hypothetical protein
MRLTAPDKELAWAVSSRVAKTCCWLGLQDAARKRREPSQTPGVWAGSVVSMDGNNVCKEVAQERWDKAVRRIHWFAHYAGLEVDLVEGVFDDEVEYGIGKPEAGMMNHKLAEKYRGFLVYTRTYTSMVPYLKGIHLSLDSWRPDRDEDGWKLSNGIERKIACETHEKTKEFVYLATRFKEDMKVLLFFFSRPTPPKLPIRPLGSTAMYMVGDASGSGFGTLVWVEGKEEIDTAYGAWDDEVRDNSSNYREALNLVIRVETMISVTILVVKLAIQLI